MWTLIILAAAAWFAYRHFKKRKYQADAKKWSVEHQQQQGRPVKRIRWKDLT